MLRIAGGHYQAPGVVIRLQAGLCTAGRFHVCRLASAPGWPGCRGSLSDCTLAWGPGDVSNRNLAAVCVADCRFALGAGGRFQVLEVGLDAT